MIPFPRSLPLNGLIVRVITASVGLPIIYLILRSGNPILGVTVTVVGSVAAFEVLSILKSVGYKSSFWVFIPSVTIVVAMGFVGPIAVFISALGASGLIVVVRCVNGKRSPLKPTVLLGPLMLSYIAIPLALFILLASQRNGFNWSILVLATVFITDTSAYFVGRVFGKHPMARSISPSKTWEGALGGAIGGIVTTLALLGVFNFSWNIGMGFALGIAIVVFAQTGDLLESKLKRVAKLKDSGQIIPGHGGILDRLDSLLPVFILIYYVSEIWPG